MKFIIKHEIKGRIRVHAVKKRLLPEEADILDYYLNSQENITSVKVWSKTGDAVICYEGDRSHVIDKLRAFRFENVEVPEHVLNNSGRQLSEEYWEKLVCKVVTRYTAKLFLPISVRAALAACHSVKYIWQGVKTLAKGRIEVPVLDAVSIGVSVARGDFETASTVMFLLGVGEILEEWTHKKSVDDLARSMSLQISKVWTIRDGQEILIPASEIEKGASVVVRMGNVIPFDGVVTQGEAMVNQSSLTGEPLAICKRKDSYVYAGTVIEEGMLVLEVQETSGSTKYEKIVAMIEDSQKLKSSLEGKAEHLADKLVPYTLAGSALAWLFTRNVTKTLSILMVDFSCALKLAMPISVLSAIREASHYHVTVKGGKYLEAMAEADTLVFDKTGTLTKAQPTVVSVISFDGSSEDELLRIAACMEEHFPHSMARAVVDAAAQKNLVHDEMHSEVEYIVAHGISTRIDGQKVIIGSYHFVFEDEGCELSARIQERLERIPSHYSCLYLAKEQKLAAVICIEDPMRSEAARVGYALRDTGIRHIVMMTGDSERTAHAIARRAGIKEYYSEVLPEDKAKFVEERKNAGNKVIMIGDGINDSPALSAADVGIAIYDGAEIAREIADVTIRGENLYEIVTLKEISDALMKRIRQNYRTIVGFNTGLLALGFFGLIAPTTAALLHNASTLVISLGSMRDLLTEEDMY